jgi:hypothetical protein
MRTTAFNQGLGSVVAAFALLAGCSGAPVVAPSSVAPQGHIYSAMGQLPGVLNPIGMLRMNLNTGQHFEAFNHCPAAGPIAYMSDFNNSVINIYKVPFAGQRPCGQLTSGVVHPQGLLVKRDTHELYVANWGRHDIVVFRRGAMSPFKTYIDPSGQKTIDVAVAKDGTVIATNFDGIHTSVGSISTWHKDGTFVGNFPNPNGDHDFFLTVQKDGTVYWDDRTNLWVGSCPAGACGTFTATGASFIFPGGLRSADGEDVVLQDQSSGGGGYALTFEPPDFGSPTSCNLGAYDPVGFDINRLQHHYFYADASFNDAVEVDYPTCTRVGSVPGNAGGLPVGLAKDYPEPLH